MANPSTFMRNVSVIIITGGSSGIGDSIIKAILKVKSDLRIYNLSRTRPKVFFDRENCVHLPTDLSDSDALQQSADELYTLVAEAPPGRALLFNNSGFGDYGRQPDLDSSKHLRMIDLNIRAVVDLTTRLLPMMLERGGYMVNIASIAGFQPTPFMATYGATKAFVLNWSLALNEDLKSTKVRALAVCPGPTRSNFFKTAGFENPPVNDNVTGKMIGMQPEEVADDILKALAKGRSLLVNGWKNNLISFFGSKLPMVPVARASSAILKKMRIESESS